MSTVRLFFGGSVPIDTLTYKTAGPCRQGRLQQKGTFEMGSSRWKNIFESQQLVQTVGVVIAVSLLWQTVRVVQKNFTLQQQVDKLGDEIAILELQNQQLKYNIEYYQTDEYLELAAREKFNKRAAGETVVALPPDDPVDPPKADEVQAEDKPQYQQNLDQWLYFLFRRDPS